MPEKGVSVVTVLVVIGIIALVAAAYLFLFKQPEKQPEPTRIIEQLIKNPTFNYKSAGFFTDRYEGDWISNGYYEIDSIDGRAGIFVIHPLDRDKGRFIKQAVMLPKDGKYVLKISVANIAGKIDYSPPTPCNDVGIKVNILDQTTGNTVTIADIVVNSDEGWRDLSYDVSSYAGKEIMLTVESYAGGPCGDWAGEWAAVDYVDIVKR